MEFEALGNTNPFRMVIDADNCADMGVPDYCSIVSVLDYAFHDLVQKR